MTHSTETPALNGISTISISYREIPKHLRQRAEPGLLDPFKNIRRTLRYSLVTIEDGRFFTMIGDKIHSSRYDYRAPEQPSMFHQFRITPDDKIDYYKQVSQDSVARSAFLSEWEFLGAPKVFSQPNGHQALQFIAIYDQRLSILSPMRNRSMHE